MSPRGVAIIGVDLDLGQGRRGVDMGPSAIRYAGLGDRLSAIGLEVSDLGNVATALPETVSPGSERARFLSEIKAACERVAARVAAVADGGRIPLVLGGDHSVAIGTVGGMAASRGGAGAAIWLDAHGDLNTPATTPSGNVHGMSLAALLGRASSEFESKAWPLPALDPAKTSLVGVRSLDDGERAAVGELGLAVHTMSELDRRGVEDVVREALERARGAAFVHISLDMDVVDPDVAPGVGTPVQGGLSFREAHLAMELIAESELLDSLEIVEVNPILDRQNETAALAVELAASALGARIL
jgi:arginase